MLPSASRECGHLCVQWLKTVTGVSLKNRQNELPLNNREDIARIEVAAGKDENPFASGSSGLLCAALLRAYRDEAMIRRTRAKIVLFMLKNSTTFAQK